MVQQVVVHLVREKLAANKEDVRQILRLVNVVKDFSHLRGTFATLDVYKLVVRQVKADDGHGFFDSLLVFLQHFGIHNERWSHLGSVNNLPKVHVSQNHLHFELAKAKFISVKFVHDFSSFALKICHLLLKEQVCTLKNLQF